MPTPKTIYFMSGTHWDREWYQSFQGFRWRLVKMLDEAIRDLEANPDFPVFTLDGQTVVLDDYLEIAPEMEPRLRRLIADGRILIGPWYDMPDEFLLSGESLVRNLLLGRRKCAQYGADPWNVGYICDIFGHAAQTPQIFAGFGLSGTVLGRGTNNGDVPAHFLWRSPDGTELPAFKLTDDVGYCDYTANVVNRMADKSDAEIDELIRSEVERESARSDIPVVFLIDATDHTHLHPVLLDHMARVRRLYPDAEVKMVDLSAMFRELEGCERPHFDGELNATNRDVTGYGQLISNTLSSRYDLKSANDRCQTLLEKWCAPLTALCAQPGAASPLRVSFTEVAYRHLLQNHPHDSICGCSIDQVHRDMHYRFDQVFEIAKEVRDYAFVSLARQAEGDGTHTRALRLLNPLPYARRGCVEADIWFEPDFPCRYAEPFGYEQRNSFRLFAADGTEIPYKLVRVARGMTNPTRADNAPYDLHTVVFNADLAPMGVTELLVVPDERPVRHDGSLRVARNAAENESTRLTVEADGTLTIADKRTGAVYTKLLRFADDGEIGDGWFHVNPTRDREVLSDGAPTAVECVEDGPARCAFRVTKRLRVPAGLSRTTNLSPELTRSEAEAELVIRSTVSLAAGDAAVEVETVVENNAENHRLKALFPTGIAGKYFASEPFCVVEREAGRAPGTGSWLECAVLEKAMTSFCGKRRGGAGLAFLSAFGLHEVSGYDDADGTLGVTLLRAFSKVVDCSPCVDGQLQGAQTYRFALLPLADETYGAIQRRQDVLAAGLKIESGLVPADYAPAASSAFAVTGGDALCYSTTKLPEDGSDAVIVRLWNQSGETVTGTLTSARPIADAAYTDLAERPFGKAAHGAHDVALTVAPWKIVTLRIAY